MARTEEQRGPTLIAKYVWFIEIIYKAKRISFKELNEKWVDYEDYSIFSFYLKPTFDFQQEILWNGEDIEVLEPLWLRKEITGKIKRMWNKNKEDK